jgi:hypothetical protein
MLEPLPLNEQREIFEELIQNGALFPKNSGKN